MPEGWSGSAWQRQNGTQGLSHDKLSPSALNADLVKEEALHALLYSKGWGMAGRIWVFCYTEEGGQMQG